MPQNSLQKHYTETVVPELMKQFGYGNPHRVPAIEKMVLNSAFAATSDRAHINYVADELAKLTGQRPVSTRAKLSVSNFKLREGQPIGCKVTLRGAVMFDFLTRLLHVALPRIRDFRGVPTKLDGRGNYMLGIADHSIFPEVSVEGNNATIGMDICITTTAATDEEGRELLRLLGFPFRKSSADAAAARETAAATTA